MRQDVTAGWVRDYCKDCADSGRVGSCARGRCYCGHPTCWAYDSYTPLTPVTGRGIQADTTHHAQSWANRKEKTWLDR